MKLQHALLPLFAGAFVLQACDSAPETNPLTPPQIQAAQVISPPVADGTDTPFFELLKVCKVWSGDDSAITTDFDVEVQDASDTETLDLDDVADGECFRVAQFDGRNPATFLGVEEVVPGGARLIDIQIQAVDQSNNPVDATQPPYNATTDIPGDGTVSGSFSADFADNTIGITVTFVNELIPTGGEGCTPGFWKNHAGIHSHSRGGQSKPSEWDGYDPLDDFNTVFGIGPSITLIDALTPQAEGLGTFLPHAVSALLNAAHPDVDYDLTEAEVIQIVQDAFNGVTSFEDAKNQLAAFNEQGCPL